MGACSGLGRVILVILNLVFLLIALAMMAVGGILRFTPGTLMTFLAAGADSAIPTLPMFPGVVVKLPSMVGFAPLFGDIGVGLLIAGAVLFVLSFLACCGACCRWRPFLIVFIIIMIVIIVVLAALGGLFLVEGSILHENIKKPLAKEISKGSGAMVDIFNLVQYELGCCGVSGENDYSSVPLTCCKDLDPVTSTCDPTAGVGFWEEGCYDKMFDVIEENKTWSIVALVVLLVLLLLEVIFAVVIVKDVGDSNKVGPI